MPTKVSVNNIHWGWTVIPIVGGFIAVGLIVYSEWKWHKDTITWKEYSVACGLAEGNPAIYPPDSIAPEGWKCYKKGSEILIPVEKKK